MSIKDIKIVEIKPNEWSKYKNIRLETLKEEPLAFNSTYETSVNYPDEYWAGKLQDHNEIHLFAQYQDSIIGTVNATLAEEDTEKGTAVIHGAYLNKSFRNLGIGKLLVKELLEKLKTIKDVKRVKLWVKETQLSARHVYESLGFRFTKKAGTHTLIMEKSM